MTNSIQNRDLVIIGGGVTGTSLAHVVSTYTDIASTLLINKDTQCGEANSKANMNSQTLHFGDIETNYTLDKATKVKKNAEMVKHYLHAAEQKGENDLFTIYNKMVIAVGEKEVGELIQRYETFKTLFPHLELIGRDEIRDLEPEVTRGRPYDQPIMALNSKEGYTVDFGALSKSFVHNAIENVKYTQNNQKRIFDLMNSTTVKHITKQSDGYLVETNHGDKIHAKTVVVSAGGYTPVIAKSLGYWKDLSILSIAGSFYRTIHKKLLNGKVYTMQNPELPFAATHGDPDVHNPDETRWGPTAKGILELERYHYSSVVDYFKVFGNIKNSLLSLRDIMRNPTIRNYLIKNFTYDIPYIGKRRFLKNEVRKIVPTAELEDIEYAQHTGGTRPQVMNTLKHSLDLGEARIIGDDIIFNITPSPGASTCLGNAENDVKQLMQFFEGKYHFDEEAFNNDLVK